MLATEPTIQEWRHPDPEWKSIQEQRKSIDSLLEELRQQVGADALVLYLACDPFIPSYLRCLSVAGELRYREACAHFRLRSLGQAEDSGFYPRAESDPMRSGGGRSQVIDRLNERFDGMFGDFVTREKILSRGWFISHEPSSGREQALLTVNFRRPTERAEWERIAPVLEERFHQLIASTEEVRTLFLAKSSEVLPAFVQMLAATDPLLAPCGEREQVGVMQQLLKCAIEPLARPERTWCVTVHRLTAQGRSLELAASEGNFRQPRRARLDVTRGEGVISWVALRKQAVRIKDLLTSKFRPIHVEYLEGVRSQLAVPILIRGQLWGTLSLETTEPDVFRLQEVGYLTRVASIAAMVAAQSEYDKVREERDLYLAAAYEAARKEAQARPMSEGDLREIDAILSRTTRQHGA